MAGVDGKCDDHAGVIRESFRLEICVWKCSLSFV